MDKINENGTAVGLLVVIITCALASLFIHFGLHFMGVEFTTVPGLFLTILGARLTQLAIFMGFND